MDNKLPPSTNEPPSASQPHNKLEKQRLKLIEKRHRQQHQQHLIRMLIVLVISLAFIGLGWYLLRNTALDWEGVTVIILGIIGLVKSIFGSYSA